MCGRYILTETNKLYERYGVDAELYQDLSDNFNVAPSQTMPVIREVNGQPSLELMRWGIPRHVGPGKTKDVFNTRADKAFWSWKKLTLSQRVLIPATGFYEWRQQPGGKQPYYIHPRDEKLFSFAGIWNAWKDDDDRVINTYSIITTDPNEDMLAIHNRMPVILHRSDETRWIAQKNNNNRELLEELLLPYDDGGLELYEVSKDVNTSKANDEHLIYPLNSE